MPMERRDQQSLNLLHVPRLIHRDRNMWYIRTTTQMLLFPNRCKRIGSRLHAFNGKKVKEINGIRYTPEPKQTLRSPVWEIRMRGSVRVLSSFVQYGEGR